LSKIEFLVKLRDGAQLIADAANEQLEREAPPEVKVSKEDVDGLKWETKEGAKGVYEQTTLWLASLAPSKHGEIKLCLNQKKKFAILN